MIAGRQSFCSVGLIPILHANFKLACPKYQDYELYKSQMKSNCATLLGIAIELPHTKFGKKKFENIRCCVIHLFNWRTGLAVTLVRNVRKNFRL